MLNSIEDEALIRNYLLGELGDAEQQGLEKRLLTDDEFYSHLLLVEDELAYDYTQGELGGRERELFEQSFLSTPGGRRQISFNAALSKYISEATADSRDEDAPNNEAFHSRVPFSGRLDRLARNALIAATLLALVVSAWLALTVKQLHRELYNARSEQALRREREQQLENQLADERARNDQLAKEGERAKMDQREDEPEKVGGDSANAGSAPVRGATVAITLAPGRTRGGGQTARLKIPQTARTVQLKLSLVDSDYESFSATLAPLEGKEVFSKDQLKPTRDGSQMVIVLSVPAAIFLNGDYRVKLSGKTASETETVDTYYFRVASSFAQK